jgi:hypothetical protein
VCLGESHEVGHHVLPPDRGARPVQLRDGGEVVLGERATHVWLLPEFEGEKRGENLTGGLATPAGIAYRVVIVAPKARTADRATSNLN